MQLSKILAGAALAALLAGGGTARANITIVAGNNPTGTEQNIQFEAADEVPGLTQTGDTNQTNSPVIFTTVFTAGPGSNGGNGTGQNIVANGIGQGDIVCAPGATPCVNNGGGSDSSELTSLQITPGGNTAWTDFIGNPTHGVGTMNVYAQDNLGHNFDFSLGQGQNFFTITASAGEVITLVQLTEETGATGPFGWADFAQPRVSGVCTLVGATCTAIPTPEPASLVLLGTGVLGIGLLARRRRN
jgi:hypothetical protein